MDRKIIVHEDCCGMRVKETISTILEGRKIRDVDHFLNPTDGDILPPESLVNCCDAAATVLDGIKNRKKFCVYYDTDMDGISAGTIMYRYLSNFTDVSWHINEAKAHGVMPDFRPVGVDILIIVDSLNSDPKEYARLKADYPVEIIVLDHHDISPNVPYSDYITLVSSQNNYGNPQLCGAGVVWKFCKYLDSLLGVDYAENLSDLAAIGTVADVSDVSENSMENRAIVMKGLNRKYNPAVRKIVGSYEFDSSSVSYSIAPLINAANRMNENESAVMAFQSDDPKEVKKYLNILNGCKAKQSEIIDEIFPSIVEQAETQKYSSCLFVMIEPEHRHMSGLIANRLMGLYRKPTFVLSERDGRYTGSCRANVENFRNICTETKEGIFLGHQQAFGVSLFKERMERFSLALDKEMSDFRVSENISVDAVIDLDDLTDELCYASKEVNRISGYGFQPINFLVRIEHYTVSSMSNGKHLVLIPADGVMFIQWNFKGSWEEVRDAQMFETPITCWGTLQTGFLYRKMQLELIMEGFQIEDNS